MREKPERRNLLDLELKKKCNNNFSKIVSFAHLSGITVRYIYVCITLTHTVSSAFVLLLLL